MEPYDTLHFGTTTEPVISVTNPPLALAWLARCAAQLGDEHRLRSALTILGIVIGIASVVLLSSIGEGTRKGIAAERSEDVV